MEDDTEPRPEGIKPANDNTGQQGEPSAETWLKIDRAALTLARIIGSRMAREDFGRLAERKPLSMPQISRRWQSRR